MALVSVDILFTLCHQSPGRASTIPGFRGRHVFQAWTKTAEFPLPPVGLQLHLFTGVKLTRCQLGIAGGRLMQLRMKPTKKERKHRLCHVDLFLATQQVPEASSWTDLII